MTGMEIVLLILGIAAFAASFLIPEKRGEADGQALRLSEEKVQEMVDGQIKDAREKIQSVVDETLTYAVERTERSLERVSNEKITAVSEFSETVLSDIHKSHEEVMFLYDMLHDKQKNLRETAKEVDRTSAIAKETKNELENAAKQMLEVQEEKEVREAKAFKPMPVLKAASKPDVGRIIEPAAIPTVEGAGEAGTNNNEKILEMHKQGKSNVAIAKELGLGVGEVKLVIDLFEVM